jgi:SAM-dependent methyltransferase
MTTPAETPREYFEHMWSLGDDPWEHGSRFYETRKYDLTVAALQRPRYARAFEPGCATGLLTERLATRCAVLIAADRHPRALRVTRDRTAEHGVDVRLGSIPDDWPDGRFDLVVLSEVLYYLPRTGVAAAVERAAESLVPGGELVAVHYRLPVAEHVLGGDEVHEIIRSSAAFTRSSNHVEDAFRLEGFVRR